WKNDRHGYPRRPCRRSRRADAPFGERSAHRAHQSSRRLMKRLVHLIALAFKQVTRHRLRTLLTLAGVATGMFLFTAVETMQSSLRIATEASAGDTTLVVYRENRFCPLTSRLPEHYLGEIRRIEGVREAIPIQIVVNNCGTSLDVIAFRGVPPGDLK